MSSAHDDRQNHLLAALPTADLRRISAGLQFVRLPLGTALYESGKRQPAVYFPTTSIISLMNMLADGTSAEIAAVGNEGIVGVCVFMGAETTSGRAVVQRAGEAYRLSGTRLKEEFTRGGIMQDLLLRYMQALLTQTAQAAVCNRHHSVDQQLCRWLLLSLDRSIGSELVVTQELIANTLGVRREGVTEAAGKLQRVGLIMCSRGRIAVLDRAGLERRTCECYAVVKKEFDRLLPRRQRIVDSHAICQRRVDLLSAHRMA